MRWPTVPLVYAETRALAEQWTYRYLAAAPAWAQDERDLARRAPELATTSGADVPDRGRLRPDIWARYRERT